jgi:ribosomal protein S12 methylthiotransferase accessory factor
MTALAAAGPTPLGDSIHRLGTLVSPYTGVIRRVEELLAPADEIPLVAVSCETGDGALLPCGPVSRLGSGSGPSRESALAAALGEAVERYSAACPASDDDLVVGCAAELGEEAVSPARFALFSPEQYDDDGFPYRPFTDTTRVSWVRGVTLLGGEPALVPAQLVYLGDAYRGDEARVGPSTSNGLACHATRAEAVLSALLEVVERDAFMIVWKNRLSLPRLTWAGDEELLAFEARYLEPTALRYAAIDLSVFWGVPTVLGVVRSEAAATGALGVGACAAPLVQTAVRKALDEACRVQAWASELRFREPEREFARDFSDVRDFEDHVHYYADHARARAADFLDASTEIRDIRSVPPLAEAPVTVMLESIARRLGEQGSSAYAVDVTAPDIRSAGLHVSKVVAPELCPLDADHRARFLGGWRLYGVAHELGLSSRSFGVADLNPHPHPFP